MPRKAAKPKPPRATPFTRNEVIGITKRFLKEEAYDAARDIPVFYRLYKQYPSEAFWRAYTLPFQLNAMFWLVGKDGQAQIKSDFAMFNLTLPAQAETILSEAKIGEDVSVAKPVRSTADLFR